MTRRILLSCVALYVAAQAFFLINIQYPRTHNFDEFHYVPSAKQFLELIENQNWEHPPLGKELMAVGIGIFGDQPLGWRFMSTVFGALTLSGMFLWALALFGNFGLALWVAAITLFNQLLYVQARIGMLDTFMVCFLVWALAAFSAAWRSSADPKMVRRYLSAVGVLMGLAVACKWAAIVPWVLCISLVLGVRLLQNWGVTLGRGATSQRSSGDEDFFSERLLQGITYWQLGVRLILIPIGVYFLTFIPFLFVDRVPSYGLWDILLMQPKMFDGQLRVVTNHPYNSSWTGWPFMIRPIWYAYDRELGEPDFVRGVILLGNPLLMWGGLLAIVVCIFDWLKVRSREAFLIAVFYLAFTFCWLVIPRKIAFYYYYYPSGMMLSLAFAYVFGRFIKQALWRWAFAAFALGFFIYFFPILSGMRLHGDEFRKWMWFQSWI